MSAVPFLSVVLAATALAVPATAGAQSVDVAAQLQARAVVSSEQALSQVNTAAAAARRSIKRSELALKRAYRLVANRGEQVTARFSAAAHAQSDNLSAVVEESSGRTKSLAAAAMARTLRMETELVNRVSTGFETQRAEATEQQGAAAGELGASHASLTADVVVAASSKGLQGAVRERLDQLTVASLAAQARLQQSVSDLAERSRSEGQSSMSSAEASIQSSGRELAETMRDSHRWEISYDESVQTDQAGASASVTVQAHVVVEQGVRR